MTTKTLDADVILLHERAEMLERYGILLAVALAHALDGDIQAARRLSQEVRVLGKAVSELTTDDLVYLETCAQRYVA